MNKKCNKKCRFCYSLGNISQNFFFGGDVSQENLGGEEGKTEEIRTVVKAKKKANSPL